MEKNDQITNKLYNALLFRQAITDAYWLRNKGFSPGGWAVDFRFLYTLFRAIEHLRPVNILEFGLGQSSKMLHQYAAFSHTACRALTIENSPEWKEFFLRSITDYPVNVALLPVAETCREGLPAKMYKGLDKVVGGERYDLIIIDGPVGCEGISRPQVIDLVPGHLARQFVILMDDTHRRGEQATLRLLAEKLKANGITCFTRDYKEEKQHTLICSEKFKFLVDL